VKAEYFALALGVPASRECSSFLFLPSAYVISRLPTHLTHARPIPLGFTLTPAPIQAVPKHPSKHCTMDKSPLGKLPPELCNRVYTLTLSGSEYITFRLPPSKRPPVPGQPKEIIRKIPEGFALDMTCKQIHQEFGPFYYANKTFVVKNIKSFNIFLGAIGEQNIKAIRAIYVQKFAFTYFPTSGPAKPNQSARDRLRSLRNLAKKYALRSVEVKAQFKNGHHLSSVSFDVLDPTKPWIRSRLSVDRLFGTHHDNREFSSMVNAEIGAWKEILVKLQQADSILYEHETASKGAAL
jgi:hypothetical protein